MRGKLAAALVIVASLLVPNLGWANDVAPAQELFDVARRLMKENDFVAACPKLEESQRLDPGIGTLFNLADCHEHLGRTATAWAEFTEVASQARTARQTERERAARARARALEPMLSRLAILVHDANPTLTVERDGLQIGRPQYDAALPVDPGDHVITARASGKRAWQRTVYLPRTGETVTVLVPELESLPIPTQVPTPAQGDPSASPQDARRQGAPTGTSASPQDARRQGAPTGTSPPTPTAHEVPHYSPPSRVAPIVAFGVAAVGIGLGITYALVSRAYHVSSDPHCSADNVCDPVGIRDRDSAIRTGNVATAAFVVGGVAAAAGVVLWVTATPGTAGRPPVATLGMQGAF